MENQPDKKSLLYAYRLPGFRTRARVDGIGGDPPVFLITLDRRQKNDLQRMRQTLSQPLRPPAASGA
jgi:hypothetical protein